MALLSELKEMVINGNSGEIETKTRECLEQGLKPSQLISEALIPAMDTVGEKYKKGEIFVPEMLVAAKSMQLSMGILKPLIAAGDLKTAGTVLIGTVQGDLHDIGKNLVSMMLEGAGFRVIDLGTDVAPEVFVNKVREIKPEILGMSALLTTTVPQIGVVVEALKDAGLREKVKVVVGGAAVTPEYAVQIGADGYSPDATGAVDWARGVVQK